MKQINFKERNEFIERLENEGYLVYESCVYKLFDGIYCKVGKIDYQNKVIADL